MEHTDTNAAVAVADMSPGFVQPPEQLGEAPITEAASHVITGAPVSYIQSTLNPNSNVGRTDAENSALQDVSCDSENLNVFEAGKTPVEDADDDERIRRQWAGIVEAHDALDSDLGTPSVGPGVAGTVPEDPTEPDSKRPRPADDPTNPEPSRVVHVRNLHFKATDADLVDALSHFGDVGYTTIMPRKRMALVEFENIAGAQSCVEYAKNADIYIAGQPALFNYSTSKFVQRLGFESEKPNHVIVIVVYNVQYPINVDVIYQVCKVYGEVRRIAMIRRSLLQALVEFDSVASATAAKKAMNGSDIYTGCCSLKVEFAKVESVKVFRNDKDQWDFTVPPESLLPADVKEAYLQQRRTLLPQPGAAAAGGSSGAAAASAPWPRPPAVAAPMAAGGQHPSTGFGGYRPRGTAPRPPPNFSGPTTARDRSLALSAGYKLYDDSAHTDHHSGATDGTTVGHVPNLPQAANVVLSGLDWDEFNCDMVFNLMCLFGNCDRVKFLGTSPESVAVQMGGPREVRNALDMLHGAVVFGREINVNSYNEPIRRPDEHNSRAALFDGSPAYKELTATKSEKSPGSGMRPAVAGTSAGTEPNVQKTPLQLDHLAGGICGGLVSTLIVHPLDLLKIRFAVNEGRKIDGLSRPQYTSYWHAVRTVFKQSGIRGLYQGALPNVIGAAASWGVYFQFYNMLKSEIRQWAQLSPAANLSPQHHCFASMLAGGMTLTLSNPIFVCKTRMCLQYEHAGGAPVRYLTMREVFVDLWRQGGVKGLYKGYVAGLFGTSHGAVQFVVYEWLREMYCTRRGLPYTAKLDTFAYIVCAGISKSIAVAATYPYQVVRSRLQDQHRHHDGTRRLLSDIWRLEGVRGFYKGLGASLLRVTPATALTFVVYEHVSNLVRQQIV